MAQRRGRQPSKSLEEQLEIVNEEINKTKQTLKELEIKKADLEKQIEDKEMRDAYNLLKQNGITLDKLTEIVTKNQIVAKHDDVEENGKKAS